MDVTVDFLHKTTTKWVVVSRPFLCKNSPCSSNCTSEAHRFDKHWTFNDIRVDCVPRKNWCWENSVEFYWTKEKRFEGRRTCTAFDMLYNKEAVSRRPYVLTLTQHTLPWHVIYSNIKIWQRFHLPNLNVNWTTCREICELSSSDWKKKTAHNKSSTQWLQESLSRWILRTWQASENVDETRIWKKIGRHSHKATKSRLNQSFLHKVSQTISWIFISVSTQSRSEGSRLGDQTLLSLNSV